jgi:phosphoserine phosphatase
MDGVLADTESSWGWVHTHLGIDNRQAVQAYLKGEIDDKEFINRDISQWMIRGVDEKKLYEILAKVPLMPGAQNCLRVLNQQDMTTAIVSAGLDILATRIAKELQIDHVVANGIEINKGKLTGRGILRVSPREKDNPIVVLCQKLQITPSDVVAIGNSHFDIHMFRVSGKGIAFNPLDQQIQNAADVVITQKNLNLVLPHVGIDI